MTLFCGKFSNTLSSPLNLLSIEPEWVISNRFSSLQFQVVTLSNHSSLSFTLAQNHKTGVCCVADAYISNKKDLLARLSCLEEGMLWSDAELILTCYEKWGIHCIDYLCGDFAIAIWDPKIEQFFLVRDPMGYRSIFYHITNSGDVFFSNTVKLLIEQFGISKEINSLRVASFLTLLIEDGEMTFYKKISKVPGGFYLHCYGHKVPVLKRYWDAQHYLNDPLIFNTREDYYHAFRNLFEDVVKCYLPEEGLIASHLSGGLDSSSVAAVAAKFLQKDNRNLITFGHVPFYQNTTPPLKRWSYCDRIYMEAFLNQYSNTVHHYMNTQVHSTFSAQFQRWLDQPAINPCNMPWWMNCVTKARELNISTILTGQGGNMTISWPPEPISKPVFSLRGMVSNIKEWCQNKLQPYPWHYYSAVHPELSRKTNLAYYYAKEEPGVYDPDPRAYYFNNNMMDYGATIFIPMRHLYHVNHYDPTLDRRIVEFCLRIPTPIFYDKFQSRLLVRKGLDDLLPKLIYDRSVRGMQAADWYMSFEQNKGIFKDYLHQWQGTHVGEYLDIVHLQTLLKKWDYRKVKQSQGLIYRDFANQYQLKFLRAIETGMFLHGVNLF